MDVERSELLLEPGIMILKELVELFCILVLIHSIYTESLKNKIVFC